MGSFFFRSLNSLKFLKMRIIRKRAVSVSLSWLLFPPGSIARMQGLEKANRKM
jgi:hypothetical protein